LESQGGEKREVWDRGVDRLGTMVVGKRRKIEKRLAKEGALGE